MRAMQPQSYLPESIVRASLAHVIVCACVRRCVCFDVLCLLVVRRTISRVRKWFVYALTRCLRCRWRDAIQYGLDTVYIKYGYQNLNPGQDSKGSNSLPPYLWTFYVYL